MRSHQNITLVTRYLEAAQVIAKQHVTTKSTAPATATDTAQSDAHLGAMQNLLYAQARLLILAGCLEPNREEQCDLGLVDKRLGNLASIAMSKFYAYRPDRVPKEWRHLYTDTLILMSFHHLLSLSTRQDDDVLTRIVDCLDRALITTGGQGEILGPKWIEETLHLLEDESWHGDSEQDERSRKRQKLSGSAFSSNEPYGRPPLREKKQCRRLQGWTFDEFEKYMNDPAHHPEPIVLTDLIGDWPAMGERPWNSMEYLLSKTLDGRRLVPVEVGRSYVDEGWGQELITFKDFLHRYIVEDSTAGDESSHRPTGYLAQHELFRQIPSLRNDTRTPDFCWADVPKHPRDPSKDQPRVDMPQLNAWFGPAKTITPLHTDGYHNLLCQVVGIKYVRLYPPSATPCMKPREAENGVDMSNTSSVDVGVVEGWDEAPEDTGDGDVQSLKERLGQLEYRECILEPGDTLLIPIGWWHYVRSLSISFSVSFWWN